MLWLYAHEHWSDIEGRCLRDGIDPLRMPASRFRSVLYSYFVDDHSTVIVPRVQVREEIDKLAVDSVAISGPAPSQPTGAPKRPTGNPYDPDGRYDRETWGRRPEHVAQARAAMAKFNALPKGRR